MLRPPSRVFLSSFLVLFLEVALIRWLPAHIRLLAYFPNVMLLASFLGIGIGCLLARARHRAGDRATRPRGGRGSVSSPIFCAGLLFGSSIRRSPDVTFDYGANLLGAMVGGAAEYLSLVTGFRWLLIPIGTLYVAALLARGAGSVTTRR